MNCKHLQLGEYKKVIGKDNILRFEPKLCDAGNNLTLHTSWMELNKLIFTPSPDNILVSVPIDILTRQQLDNMESLVRDTVKLPSQLQHKQKVMYKPLEREDVLNIPISGDCWCFHHSLYQDRQCISTQTLAEWKRARYRFHISINKICFQSHRDEVSFGIILRMSAIEVADI